jgi:molybdopterin converting factor subunit 1
MQVRVLFFATLRERTGVRETELDLPNGIKVQEFKSYLAEQYPGLATGISSMLVAVNREFALNDQIIPDNAEVAIFPPVSGG